MTNIIYALFISALFCFSENILSQSIYSGCLDESMMNDYDLNIQIANWLSKKVIPEANNKKLKGTYLRHTIDHQWIVNRDEFNAILSRQIIVGVAKKDSEGKCKYITVTFKQDYMGGGQYGDLYANDVNSTFFFPLDCECVMTTKDWLAGGSGNTSNGSSQINKVNTELPKDGPYEQKGEDGLVYKTGQYLNGKKTGAWKKYGEGGNVNGKLELEENYKDGELDGVRKQYDDNGTVRYSEEYKAGKLNGKTILYEKGVLTLEKTFVDGVQIGKQITYYNGKKEKEEEFANGKKNGLETWYYIENGKVKETLTYKDDKLDGPYKRFSKDGKLEQEGNYKDGYKDGEWKKYDAAGKVTEKIFYVKGEEEK